jgi:hypothetical protein
MQRYPGQFSFVHERREAGLPTTALRAFSSCSPRIQDLAPDWFLRAIRMAAARDEPGPRGLSGANLEGRLEAMDEKLDRVGRPAAVAGTILFGCERERQRATTRLDNHERRKIETQRDRGWRSNGAWARPALFFRAPLARSDQDGVCQVLAEIRGVVGDTSADSAIE